MLTLCLWVRREIGEHTRQRETERDNEIRKREVEPKRENGRMEVEDRDRER